MADRKNKKASFDPDMSVIEVHPEQFHYLKLILMQSTIGWYELQYAETCNVSAIISTYVQRTCVADVNLLQNE